MIARPINPAIPQLDQLTGLRGLAAWFVVFYHMRTAMNELVPSNVMAVLGRGYLAVDLFFMLSGFVMWLNYGERIRNGGWAASRDFWWKRVARIWPLHLLILAGMVAFALVVVVTGKDATNYPFAELPMHVLLVQNWGFTANLTWNHPAWSISTELGAYLVFPAFVMAVRWERLPTIALVAVAAGLMVSLHLLFASFEYTRLGDDIPRMGLLRCLIQFSIGALLCVVWQRLVGGQRHTQWVALLMAVAALSAGWQLDLPETMIAPIAMAGGLLWLALDTGPLTRLLASRLLRWLGDISYSTYLVHTFLFILFKIVFVGDNGQLTLAESVAMPVLVLIASAILYHRFEKPAQRWVAARPPRGFGRPPVRTVN